MSDPVPTPKIIVVAGDVTMDWNIARREDYQGSGLVWNAEDYIRTYSKPGGAALLAELIDAVARKMNEEGSLGRFEVKGIEQTETVASPDDERYHHSYAIWSLYKYDESSPEHKDIRVWRVKNYLGFHPSASIKNATVERWNKVAADIPKSTLIVLDDATIILNDNYVGFRQQSEIWQGGLTFSDGQLKSWIIIKMARPVAKGKLWEHLKGLANRLIVVIPVNELRMENALISRELSWERTAQDIVWELENNFELADLSQCAHVVVSFGTAGALLLSNAKSKAGADEESDARNSHLVFDPKVIEEMWGQNHPGGVVGYTSCLVTSLAHQVMLSQNEPDIHQGIQNGLRAIRLLHKEGYGKPEDEKLEFPINKVVRELMGPGKTAADDSESRDHPAKQEAAKDKSEFSVVPVKNPTVSLTGHASPNGTVEDGRFWMILHDGKQDLYPLAEDIVIHGAKQALKGVPLGEFGDLLTADRREIESYRSVSALVREYCAQERPERPLSIAVFGPPGSGKSFGISEVAKTAYKEIKKLTFNLSQFSDPKELLGALHQVRDEALTGSIPLVFWDEFDTALNNQPLGWLRYFLAPMQDGKFQDGQITHPIGRAIFVFAGGTSSSRREFERHENLKEVKGSDFISRLKGFIDIMGPNRVEEVDTDHLSHIIRRAILLRSLFERKTPNLFRWSDKKGELRIDEGVLRAFLKISRYRHGARSMESIIEMSRLARKSKFERSALPPETQLDLHVNGRVFLAIVMVSPVRLIEDLAREVHQLFRKNLEKDGYTWGPESSLELRTHSSLVPFEELPEDEQEQNRNQVRDIQQKLSAIGYMMIPARDNEPFFEFSHREIEFMAEMEHERWMKEKLKNNWSYARKTNKKNLEHQDILFWRKLSEDELREKFSEDELKRIGKGVLSEEAKEKDRDAVRAIPQLIAKTSYTIAKAQDESEKDKRRQQGPRPTVKIGVTGLRKVADADAIKHAVASAVGWIERAFPGHQLAVISTLAEGAERLVVKHILEKSGTLGLAILPQAEEEYETEFKTLTSKQEFRALLEQADDVHRILPDLPDAVYKAAGQYMLDHSDVLVSIWDGEPSPGQDQTSELIAEARKRELPIAWIHAVSEESITEGMIGLRVKPGSLTLENF